MRQKGFVASWAFDQVKAEDLEKASEELIEKTRAAYERVGALKEDEINFESCIQVCHDFFSRCLFSKCGDAEHRIFKSNLKRFQDRKFHVEKSLSHSDAQPS